MYTKQKKIKVLEAVEKLGGNIDAACKSENISRAVFYQWLKNDEIIKDNDGINQTFAELFEEIKEKSIDNVETAFYKKCLEGDTTAMIFYLKTRGKDRGYIEKKEIDLNVPGKKMPPWFSQANEE